MQSNRTLSCCGELKGRFHVACVCVVVSILYGCSSTRPQDAADFAEIDVTVASGCKQPSVFVRELRDAQSQKIKAMKTPIRVPSGVYSIGVSCGTILSSDATVCVDTSAASSRSEVDAYELVLQAGRRYVYSCGLMKSQNVIRLSESAL